MKVKDTDSPGGNIQQQTLILCLHQWCPVMKYTFHELLPCKCIITILISVEKNHTSKLSIQLQTKPFQLQLE